MRKIKARLYAGVDTWPRELKALQERVSEGASMTSALQQPAHSDSPRGSAEDARQRARLYIELVDTALDILTALGLEDDFRLSLHAEYRVREAGRKLRNHDRTPARRSTESKPGRAPADADGD